LPRVFPWSPTVWVLLMVGSLLRKAQDLATSYGVVKRSRQDRPYLCRNSPATLPYIGVLRIGLDGYPGFANRYGGEPGPSTVMVSVLEKREIPLGVPLCGRLAPFVFLTQYLVKE